MSGGSRPGAGRKKKGNEARVSLSVRVSPATMAILERIAVEAGISLGAAVDKIVLEGVPTEEPYMEPAPTLEPFEAPVEEAPVEAAPEGKPLEFTAWVNKEMVKVQVTPLEAGVAEAVKAALEEGGSLKAVPLLKELDAAGKVKVKVNPIG